MALSGSRDDPGVYTAGSHSAGVPARAFFETLKNHGFIPQKAEYQEGHTIEDVLNKYGLNPHTDIVGERNPAVNTIVHEMVHASTPNMATITPDHPPAPATSPNPEVSLGVPYSGSQSADPNPAQWSYMVQGEQYMVQVWSGFETEAQVLEQGLDGNRLPKWAVASFEMPVTVADVLSQKNEVYPKNIWEQCLPQLQAMAQGKMLLGRNDHPSNPGEVLGETSLLFSSVDWAPMKRQDGGHELVARGYIYNTSAGRDLHTILQSGVPVDVSSRGFGSTQAGTWRGKSAQIVQNFVCKAFDAVIGGASPGAGFSRGRLTQSATHDDVVRHIDSARKVQLRVMPTLRRKA